MNKILILTPDMNDPQATILYEEVLSKGGHPILQPFNLKDINFSIGKNQLMDESMENVRAVFIRGISTDLPLAHPPYTNEMEASLWRARYMKENYKINLVSSWLRALELRGVLIVNPLRTYLHHNTKTQFFQYLSMNNISVPKTFATNDLKYLRKTDEELVSKCAGGVGATMLVPKKITDISLKKSPPLFQEQVTGDTVRVHTVGEKVILSLKIISKGIDSRSDTRGFEVIELSQAQENEIIKANKLIGLHFSAWDVIAEQNDKIYLLDCNPGPYIYWIGGYFTRLVKSEMAKYLVAFADSGSIEKAEDATSKPNPIVTGIKKIPEEVHHYFDDSFENWKKDLGIRH